MPRYDQQRSPASCEEAEDEVSECPGRRSPAAVGGSERYCVLLFHLLGIFRQHLHLLHERRVRKPHLRAVLVLQRLLQVRVPRR
jgi:hypothetical protein